MKWKTPKKMMITLRKAAIKNNQSLSGLMNFMNGTDKGILITNYSWKIFQSKSKSMAI